jgi:hypothetical protein
VAELAGAVVPTINGDFSMSTIAFAVQERTRAARRMSPFCGIVPSLGGCAVGADFRPPAPAASAGFPVQNGADDMRHDIEDILRTARHAARYLPDPGGGSGVRRSMRSPLAAAITWIDTSEELGCGMAKHKGNCNAKASSGPAELGLLLHILSARQNQMMCHEQAQNRVSQDLRALSGVNRLVDAGRVGPAAIL